MHHSRQVTLAQMPRHANRPGTVLAAYGAALDIAF